MRVVIDTNVVVSAMLSPHGPPAQVVRLALQGDLVALHDERILSEYRNVLLRPKFGFEPGDVRAVVEGLGWAGEAIHARPVSVDLPDPDDLPFVEVAAAGYAHGLVTGNPRQFQPVLDQIAVAVWSPGELLRRMAQPGDPS